ncbi:hypothetical protein MHYP_G00205670 [Metynnis hypsauchen]
MAVVVVVEVLGLILAILGWCLESSSTKSNMWRVHSHINNVVTSSSQYEGLWMTCAANAMGAIQCHKYQTILGLPKTLNHHLLPSCFIIIIIIIVIVMVIHCCLVSVGWALVYDFMALLTKVLGPVYICCLLRSSAGAEPELRSVSEWSGCCLDFECVAGLGCRGCWVDSAACCS